MIDSRQYRFVPLVAAVLLLISSLGLNAGTASSATPALRSGAGPARVALASTGPVFKPSCRIRNNKTYRVALIIAQGGLGDQSYNDLAYSGFRKAESDFPIVGRVIQSADIVSQGRQILQSAGQAGFDLVVDLEFSTADALKAVGPTFPKTHWMIVNLPSNGANITGYLFNEQDGSYLAGALAALVSQNSKIPGSNGKNVIGAIGGVKSPGIDKFLVGYEQGARRVNKNVKVLISYANNFGDPAKGKELADSMFSQGAAVVYQVAGGTGVGIIQAAKQRNRFAIGVDTDQDSLAPGHVLTSMIKRTDYAVYNSIDRLVCGTLKGGTSVTLGLKQGSVGISPMKFTRTIIPAAYVKRVSQLRANIVSGKIHVWNVITQGYPSWFH